MITFLALAALPLLGSVEEPTPIDSTIVQLVIDDPAMSAGPCDSYRTLVALVDDIGFDAVDRTTFVDMIDAYVIVTVESDSLRLDNGARDTFTNWLHGSCS